jgi:hypothetical protein
MARKKVREYTGKRMLKVSTCVKDTWVYGQLT